MTLHSTGATLTEQDVRIFVLAHVRSVVMSSSLCVSVSEKRISAHMHRCSSWKGRNDGIEEMEVVGADEPNRPANQKGAPFYHVSAAGLDQERWGFEADRRLRCRDNQHPRFRASCFLFFAIALFSFLVDIN